MQRQTRKTLLATVAALALAPASAADFALGSGNKVVLKGSITAGTGFRADARDTDLLPNVNSSVIGVTGTAPAPNAGRNQDDGNLNFDKGDAVAKVVNAYGSADFKFGNYGVLGSAKAWYDHELEQGDRVWGNFTNGYAAGTPLSDAGAQARSRFSGVALDNLYAYGRNQFDAMTLEWQLGWQKLDWGNRFIVLGGLRELNPIDGPAVVRPGMLQREQETRIPVPQLFGRLALNKATNVEAFYQFRFERNAPGHCGTFFAGLDYLSDGCDGVMVGNQSDRAGFAAGNYLKRAETLMASNSGQFGAALHHTVEEWQTKFGLYATQFHLRSPNNAATKSLRTGPAPYVPGDPGGLNPKYYTEYVEDVRMLGVSFESRLPFGIAFGELTYRPNQPYGYNAGDLIAAFTSNAAPTPLRAAVNALAPGEHFKGWERHKAVQLQLGLGGQLPKVLGAAGMNWGAELVYKGVPDLPDVAVTRFGRSDLFGLGPVNGVCTPPATATPEAAAAQCSNDGYVSSHAFGYRLRAGLRYANVFEGVDLLPSLLFGHDVSGWSADGGIHEGRKLAVLSLRANIRGGWMAQLDWLPTWGGTYNNLRDRSVVQVWGGYQF